MEPKIETLPEKKFIGIRTQMSLTKNKTFELWRDFMPRRNEIKNNIGTDLFSIEIYPQKYFDGFDPNNDLEKWAAIEVRDFDNVPDGMKSLTIPTGLYAVFVHKGPASTGFNTYQYIFKDWLPKSDFIVDTRPHFALMGARYKKEDPSSEEELWIPITRQ